MKIISSKPVSISEVKSILEDRAKDGELESEQQTVLEYTESFSRFSKTESAKLIKQLMKDYEGLNEETAIKIVDICPKSLDVLRIILAKDMIGIEEDKMKEIVKLISK